MSQRGLKYIDADEAFRRVMRDAKKQGAYLFYHKKEGKYQVVRECWIFERKTRSYVKFDNDTQSLKLYKQENKPARPLTMTPSKKRLAAKIQYESDTYIGFYDKNLDIDQLRADIEQAALHKN